MVYRKQKTNISLVLSPLLDDKGDLAIRRKVSLVDMITNTEFSNCPNVFEIGVQYRYHSLTNWNVLGPNR